MDGVASGMGDHSAGTVHQRRRAAVSSGIVVGTGISTSRIGVGSLCP